jgi:Na+-driven multidrug efflux pump
LRLRSPYDREILALALPALGALAAEPLYLLADTAMVGHLGTEQLAALAIAATLLTGAFTLFNFLTYGTTAQVARLSGAARHADAGRLAAQALWLASGIGVALTATLVALAVPLVDLMGGDGHTGELAVLYLRIGSLGLPFALIALAGQGFLRGVSDLRTPLAIVVVANVVNVLLNLLFIYGFGWGLAGSAWATVVAQAGMGAAFVIALLGAPAASRRPSLAAMRPLMRVIDQLHEIWPLFALMQPVNGAVFALDGILIGAGDTRFLMWGMLAAALLVFVPVALASLAFELGIVGVWCGLLGLIAVRLGTCGWRFRGRRWAIVGSVGSAA